MEKDLTNKKILYFGLLGLLVIFIIGIVWTNNKPKAEEYTFPSPKEVVEQYFTAWNNKNYVNMYATFSDGFKKIEPTAKDLATFKESVNAQGIEGVNVINIEEKSNDGKAASVSYSVVFLLSDGSRQSLSDRFTLKYRQGDIIQGWKLIHPYGENIDNS